jgi:hypothetical protein
MTLTIAVDLGDRPQAFRWTLIFVGCQKREHAEVATAAVTAALTSLHFDTSLLTKIPWGWRPLFHAAYLQSTAFLAGRVD